MTLTTSRVVVGLFAGLSLGLCSASAFASGSIFLTGHDPDFHALLGGNALGAQHINQAAINFIQDPGFNPFVAAAPKFLLVESTIAPPGGHTIGTNGIIASGYAAGVNFDRHDATTLNAALNLLGVPGGYSAIVVCSDFGGILTQAELNILNARTPDIATFVDAGGGLYAMAEGNSGAGLTPAGGFYNFVPGVVSSLALNQNESGFSVTPFGASLGLTSGDINGNASHTVFTGIGALTIVDQDAAGNILSIAGRVNIPGPGSAGLLAFAGVAIASRRRRA